MATVDLLRPRGSKNAWTWETIVKKALVTFQIAGGEASAHVHSIVAGALLNDIHIDKVSVSLENAPGGAGSKAVTVTVSDGETTMTVTVTDPATDGSTTTNNFDLDVSEKPLTTAMSSTSATATGCCSVTITYHEVTL